MPDHSDGEVKAMSHDTPGRAPVNLQLRAAVVADCDALAGVWHAAWHDAHAPLVSRALLPHRARPYFEALARKQYAAITVAEQAGQISGFVGIDDDELELLFVSAAARGSGVADALIQHGERQLARHHAQGYLVVVEGNARARRFYERHGWHDAGPLSFAAPIPGGSILVPSRRYEKQLRG